MATVSETLEAPRKPSLVAVIDRWIYVFMAALFVATALAGFVPASIFKVTAMQAGDRPWFPPVAHVHASLMGLWLLFLLAQTWLMATGRSALHWKLGALALALVPAMVVAGMLLVAAVHAELAEARAAEGSAAFNMLQASADSASNILLAQIRIAVLFTASVGLALAVRRKVPGLHKRLMLLGTAALLPPAFARITFLPNTMPDSYLAQDAYTLLWISPMLLWDLYRSRRIHLAYWLWLGLFVPLSLVVQGLWSHPDWLSLAPKLVGVG